MGRREEFTVGMLNITGGLNFTSPGLPITGVNPSGAMDYYVDGNKTASGNGLSWDTAVATLEEAITLSNASIKLAKNRWWARRNRIFFAADASTEDLTKLPTKCDIIGVGSYDGFSKPGLIGHHSSSVEAYGTRFFNVKFNAKAAASAIFTLAGSSSNSGVEFHGCEFDATAGTVTSAILSTAMPFLKVYGCRMRGAFATSFISFGAGEAGGAEIVGNIMSGSLGKGIVVPGTTTASWEMFAIDNNIQCAGLWVDDDADILYVIGNRAVTAIDCATYTAGFDMNLLRASNNFQTGGNAGDHDSVPHVLFS
jgi:hypothetical protein